MAKDGSDYDITSNSVILRIYKVPATFTRATKTTATFTTVSSATSFLRKTQQRDKATPLGRPCTWNWFLLGCQVVNQGGLLFLPVFIQENQALRAKMLSDSDTSSLLLASLCPGYSSPTIADFAVLHILIILFNRFYI